MTVRIPTVEDEVDEPDSAVRVVVDGGHNYNPDLEARNVRVLVESNDLGPITAAWASRHDEHDGESTFSLEFAFSHEPVGYSYKTVHEHLLDVTGAAITKANRVVRGRNRD